MGPNIITIAGVLATYVAAAWVIYRDSSRTRRLELISAALGAARQGSPQEARLREVFNFLATTVALDMLVPRRNRMLVASTLLIVMGSAGLVWWFVLSLTKDPDRWVVYGISLVVVMTGGIVRATRDALRNADKGELARNPNHPGRPDGSKKSKTRRHHNTGLRKPAL